MNKVSIAVSVATLFAVFYNVSPYIGVPDNAILLMFMLSPFVVVAMAYIILKYGKPSTHTFDERFYDDVE